MRTRSRSGTIRPVNYRALDQGQEKPKEHTAIVDSQSSSSSGGHAVHSFAADTPEEMAQQQAIQAQAQRDQQEQLRAQAQTIDTLKTLIQQVLERSARKSPSIPAQQDTARTRRALIQTAPFAFILRMSLMTKSSLQLRLTTRAK